MKIHPKADPVSRQVRKRGDMKKAAYVADHKIRGIAQMESNLEASGTAVCAIDPRILHVRPQPFTFDLRSGKQYASKVDLIARFSGEEYSPKPYTPDFHVSRIDASDIYLEIKHSQLIEDDPSVLDLPAVMSQFGVRLVIVTEEVITDALAFNARLLRPYSSKVCSLSERRTLLRALSRTDRIGGLIENGISQSLIFTGILDGTVTVDLQQRRLVKKTRLKGASQCTKHLELLPI